MFISSNKKSVLHHVKIKFQRGIFKIVENALEYIYNKLKLISKLNEKMIQYSNDFRFERCYESKEIE